MNYKVLAAILLVFIVATTVNAAAPTVGAVTVTNSYTNDLNYFGQPFTLSATASGDINADSECWYFISTGGTPLAGDFNSDTNVCSKTIASVAGNDDFNFSIVVLSGTGDANGTSPTAYYWKDTNAPSVAKTDSGEYTGTRLTLTCSDTATNTGNGSGCATIYYSTDGGTSYSSTTNSSVVVSLSEPGNYDVNYYAVDQIGNTVSSSQTSYTIRQMPVSSCSMIALSLFLVAVGLILFTVMGAFVGKLDVPQLAILLVAVVITLVIAWTIYNTTGCAL